MGSETTPPSTPPVRVVIADDSTVMRRLISDSLGREARIEVVGEAGDGDEALAACERLRPDVLTLDLSMPNTNGLDVLQQLRQRRSGVRVVVISSFSTSLVERALDVLDAGATDLVAKPKLGETFGSFGESAVRAVLAAAHGARAPQPVAPATPRVAIPRATSRIEGTQRILVIASSTGGPKALGELVPALGSNVGAGAIIVQHMPPGFTTALARRLDASSPLEVREAGEGDRIAARTVFVAPAGTHLRVAASGAFTFDTSDPVGGVRPRADLTIEDLVAAAGARVVLVVLTGMGNDGLCGAQAVHGAGGIVLAQDERDCVVYGMPRHVVEHDLADATGTLDELPILIERALATPVARAAR